MRRQRGSFELPANHHHQARGCVPHGTLNNPNGLYLRNGYELTFKS